MDGGPGRQAKARQHRRGRGLAGAHRRRHTKRERRDKIQTLQLHVPRGHTAQGSCGVEQERDNTGRGSTCGDTTGRKRRQQHRLRVVRPMMHRACGPGHPELSKSYMDMASKLFTLHYTRKRSSQRRASATELSRPGKHWHSNSRRTMWRHLCSLAASALGADPKSGHAGKTRSWQRLHAAATAVSPKPKQ